MNIAKTLIAATFAATALSAPALAQDTEFQLPEQCTLSSATGGMGHSAMGHGAMDSDQSPGMGSSMRDMMESMGMGGMDLDTMPEHVRENMRRMMISMPAMHEGLMKDDADVAFACGMIAHHQGAIDMAQVLLEYGDDPQMIELGGKIIAAQVGEIEEMIAWLAENAE